ncbi:riboflavin synthase [Rheinheimera sp. UJ51]|uniref:riboflavin synthase n=1 Tax=Rheinheimera sp. UJ51 TaxID=2892446 RepID=UPI001E474807|nr:riboflavin synthase [Rheinheimera sp. UJ51]MCC5450951.1 riboflavin synthase [Rheinheimera sp. UJ51]
MFTGIIAATGHISRLTAKGGDLEVQIHSEQLDFSDVQLGDSIASNGVCLTVTQLLAQGFIADVSAETLALTRFSQYQVGQRVNLEKALLATGRLGGHLVSGHVDGVTELLRIEKTARAWQLWFAMPAALAPYLAHKGSVTIDGVSLTVNELSATAFRLTIVPHTAAQTTLLQLQKGSLVHIEVDLIARYLERLLHTKTPAPTTGVDLALLAQRGFL